MNGNISVDEIDISDKQSLELVLNFLEKYNPESYDVWQLLKNIQDDIIRKDCLWLPNLYVNNRHDIKCVIFIYWNIGNKINFDSLTEEDRLNSRSVVFFCDKNDDDLLMNLIQQIIPWSTIQTIVFSAIQHRFSLLIEKLILNNNLGECHISSYQQMDLDKQTFEEKTKNFAYNYPTDIVIRPLSPLDATIINDLWTYRSSWTLAQIIYEIEHFPSFGAYQNDELISWTLTRYNGSIGSVYTKSESRGLGLATILNYNLTSKLFEKQERIFCYIAYDNIGSFKAFEKLGYYRTQNVDWLIFSSK